MDTSSRHIANLAGVNASPSSLQHWSLTPGTEVLRFEQEDGSVQTREPKLAVIYAAESRDPEIGAALKDKGSTTFSCLIDSAAVLPVSFRFRHAP